MSVNKFYTNDYQQWQLGIIINGLLHGYPIGSSLVDVGCGTGVFSEMVGDRLGLDSVTLVDPLSGVGSPLTALEFATMGYQFDFVLLKESIHHTPEDQLEQLFQGLYDTTNGCCMIVTRPKYDVEYPFNNATRKKWERSQTPPHRYLDLMKKCGFRDCLLKTCNYEMTMTVDDWIHCVKSKMWSIFDDDESEYIDWLKKNFKTINFQERLVIVKGVK